MFKPTTITSIAAQASEKKSLNKDHPIISRLCLIVNFNGWDDAFFRWFHGIYCIVECNLLDNAQFFSAIAVQTEMAAVIGAPLTHSAIWAEMFFAVGHNFILGPS